MFGSGSVCNTSVRGNSNSVESPFGAGCDFLLRTRLVIYFRGNAKRMQWYNGRGVWRNERGWVLAFAGSRAQ